MEPEHVLRERECVVGGGISVLLDRPEHGQVGHIKQVQLAVHDVDATPKSVRVLLTLVSDRAAPLEDERLQEHLEGVGKEQHYGLFASNLAWPVEEFDGKA